GGLGDRPGLLPPREQAGGVGEAVARGGRGQGARGGGGLVQGAEASGRRGAAGRAAGPAAAEAEGGAREVRRDGGLPGQPQAQDGLPLLSEEGLADRLGAGGERVQGGGGAEAEAGGHALGRERHRQRLPPARPAPQRTGAVGRILAPP